MLWGISPVKFTFCSFLIHFSRTGWWSELLLLDFFALCSCNHESISLIKIESTDVNILLNNKQWLLYKNRCIKGRKVGKKKKIGSFSIACWLCNTLPSFGINYCFLSLQDLFRPFSPEKNFWRPFFWDRLKKNFEDLFFLENTCVCVVGPWPWPREGLSLALKFFCVLGLGLEPCVLDSTSVNYSTVLNFKCWLMQFFTEATNRLQAKSFARPLGQTDYLLRRHRLFQNYAKDLLFWWPRFGQDSGLYFLVQTWTSPLVYNSDVINSLN